MKRQKSGFIRNLGMLIVFAAAICAVVEAQSSSFHNAPASAKEAKNPFAGENRAAEIGGQIYAVNCAKCHGPQGQGTGNIPALKEGPAQAASEGELFWFVTKGDAANGMPAWSTLSDHGRWQIVSYMKAGLPAIPRGVNSPELDAGISSAPAPKAPFTDFRHEAPGTVRKITVQDLPAPFTTESAGNAPKLVNRPPNAWPKAPAGFKVDLYATGLHTPRLIRMAPNGDYFVAESDAGDIKVFRGISGDSKPEQVQVFASGLNRPYGIAFYPPGANPQWVYIGNTDSVVRFPYQNGDLKARGPAERLASLPVGGGHWTRERRVLAGRQDDVRRRGFRFQRRRSRHVTRRKESRGHPGIHARRFGNAHLRLGNPQCRWGLAIDPQTGELWCSVNERDGLGDNLVPDYITHVQEGGFYGWPWWYMGGHQDPRHEGKHPELKTKVITPDVLLQPHNASLQMTFYDGKQFPAEYRGDIFAAEHGSWNKSVRTGYEVIRVPLHQSGHASGEYEDFLTGFVLDDGSVWGRPVGVAVAPDGSLLVSDDGSNSIWRVSYSGK